MEVRPFDPTMVPTPWRGILEAEVKRLSGAPEVLAVGIAGSWALDDTWPHSDIDLEVVVRGDHDFSLTIREQEGVGLDVATFGENIIEDIPFETRPIYDPRGILGKELGSRDRNRVLARAVNEGLDLCGSLLQRARESLPIDPRAALVFLHLFSWNVAEVITVAAGDNRTIVRRCSRLERAVQKVDREDLLSTCEDLFGFPETLLHSRELLTQLQEGYREVWSCFKGKTVGHPYMTQQPDSELWFHNRIEPVYRNDPRDLVWIVYVEFPGTTAMLFRNLTEREELPPDMFREAESFPEAPRKWVRRHLECLKLFPSACAEGLLPAALQLMDEARRFAALGLYRR